MPISLSMSTDSSSTAPSLWSFSLRDSISPGRTNPRCLLSSTRSDTFGTYPRGSMPISLTRGATASKTFLDIWLKMTPRMLFSAKSLNPFRTATVESEAPLAFTRRTTGMPSLLETSLELAKVPSNVTPS